MDIPKRKTIDNWLKDHPCLNYDESNSTIYCSACDIHLKKLKKHTVQSHLTTQIHLRGSNAKNADNTFYLDLIIFLVACNIPWNKINNPQFRIFFEKYICCSCTSRKFPAESSLRKIYLDFFYNEAVQKIRDNMAGKYIWLTVDETVNMRGKCVANVIIRELAKNTSCKFYLIGSKILDIVDGNSMAELIKKQLKFLWQNSYNENLKNVLLLTTGSAAHMLEAGKILKGVFPNLLHVTCFAHGIHQVSEYLRSQHKNVYSLTAKVNKIFAKSPNRKRLFKQICPSLALPPHPGVTKSSTWLNAIIYNAENFDHIAEVIAQLNPKESPAVRELKIMFKDPHLRNDLIYLKENLGFLCDAIIKLQTPYLSLVESFEILDHVRTITDWCGSDTMKLKLEEVLDGIPDYDKLRDHADLIKVNKYEDSITEYYKYAPVTLFEVERTFSSYKWIYNDTKSIWQNDNLEKLMTIMYYYREDEVNVISTDLDYDTIDTFVSDED